MNLGIPGVTIDWTWLFAVIVPAGVVIAMRYVRYIGW